MIMLMCAKLGIDSTLDAEAKTKMIIEKMQNIEDLKNNLNTDN